MNIQLSERNIIDRCGLNAFQRGESYYKAGKVRIWEDETDVCMATVEAKEDFDVTIRSIDGKLKASCSCPKLASFSKDCQHIAAVCCVLLARQNENHTQDFLQAFSTASKRSLAAQSYFETRNQLNSLVTVKVIEQDGEHFLAIELEIENVKITPILDFLISLRESGTYKIAGRVVYDSSKHYFSSNTAAILEELIEASQVEYKKQTNQESELILIPSVWKMIYPHVKEHENVQLQVKTELYPKVQEEKSILPLTFTMEGERKEAKLTISGMEQLTVLPAYQLAVYHGVFYPLSSQAAKQLVELEKVLTNHQTISIAEDQAIFFSEKVLPKLKEIGQVNIAEESYHTVERPQLAAKLFLDRVNHRLLADIEFHYDYFVIHPVQENEQNQTVTIRDTEKEARILQLIDTAGFTKTDGGYYLHNEALEYEFLYHLLPELENHVQIYATTAVRNRILPQPVTPKIRIKQQKERMNWLEFSFEMEGFPEKEIKEVLQALDEKRKYYRLRSGALLSLETKEFQEIHDFLLHAPYLDDEPGSNFELPLVEGLKLADRLNEKLVKKEKSFEDFLETLVNRDPETVRVPATLQATLRDYQKQGFSWMRSLAGYGFGGVLADDMGLGKTIQAITYTLSFLQQIREDDEQILVICPSSVMYQWKQEFERFANGVKVDIIIGNIGMRKKKLSQTGNLDVIITSYPMIRNDSDWYQEKYFHTIFFDEAQSFKNPRTQTSRVVKKLRATAKFALTGTPIENSTEELWSIYHVVFPELFGSLEEYQGLTTRKIRNRIEPFLLRRMKKDVVDELPEKMEQIITVELGAEQKTMYGAYLAKLKQETLKHLDKETMNKNRIRILAGLTRLRQICCHPRLFVEGYEGESTKLNRFLEIIKEALAEKRRILVFSQFTSMLAIIARELAQEGVAFFYLDGATPAEDRVEMTTSFNGGKRDVFLISLKAGGTGLNLPGADTVILYDIWWNPAVEEQATDRAYRIGQEKTVQVIKLITKGTIEEKMNKLQERKRQLIQEIIEPTGQVKNTLTVQDIQELLND